MERESERRELWHQLDNESDRAHDAFKYYMLLPPAERSVVGAWREWTGNPSAKREPPYFAGWAKDYAWSDRARARDHHLEVIREWGMEAAIEEEAKKQARQVERLHWRYQELMSVGYERAMEYLESEEFVKHVRPSDVMNLIKLHFEGVQKLGDPNIQTTDSGVDWSEDEQRELDRIVGELDAEEAQAQFEEGSSENSGEDNSDEGTEETG
jgi:hypothetical protein